MNQPSIHVETISGSHVVSTRYEPAGLARATLLALPGIGVRQSIFETFGRWQAARGVRVVSIDWTGVGLTPMTPGAGQRTTLTSWATEDAVAALRSVRSRFDGPVVLVGHSFGGQALAVADELQEVEGIALVASQTPWWRFFSPHVVPVFFGTYPVLGPWMERVPGWLGVGTTLPGGVVTEWSRWGRSRETYFRHVPGATVRLARIDVPVLAFSFPDDPLATPPAVADLLARLPGDVLRHEVIAAADVGLERIGHIGFFRDQAFSPYWADIADLAATRAAARRAG